jgi:hypothetical protein
VPRPFVDEAFGSWFGRVAARYRITVGELATAGGLHLDLGRDDRDWLISQPPQQPALARLCHLCALPQGAIEAMRATTPAGPRLWYCFNCLFMNPVEVESPYWRTDWLKPDCVPCRRHPDHWEYILPSDVGKRLNMRRLLRFISRRMPLESCENNSNC